MKIIKCLYSCLTAVFITTISLIERSGYLYINYFNIFPWRESFSQFLCMFLWFILFSCLVHNTKFRVLLERADENYFPSQKLNMDHLSVRIVRDFRCQQEKSDLHSIKFIFDPAFSGLSGKRCFNIVLNIRCCMDYKLEPVIKIT